MKAIIGITLFVAGVIVLIYFGAIQRFINPDMTEMRLLYTFWKQYLLGLALTIIGMAVLKWSTK